MAPKFFYDALGSRLDAITELPEYYPTRIEAAIFAADGAAIAEAALACSVRARRRWWTQGAGNCAKAARPSQRQAAPLRGRTSRWPSCARRWKRCSASIRRWNWQAPRQGLLRQAALLPPLLLGGGGVLVFYPGSSIGTSSARRGASPAARSARAGARRRGGGRARRPRSSAPTWRRTRVLEAAYDDRAWRDGCLQPQRAAAPERAARCRRRPGAMAAWAADVVHSRIEMHLRRGMR
ncbi:MAG: L-histidine N(alpha)-methyltransferase [Rubrivivax sp.]